MIYIRSVHVNDQTVFNTTIVRIARFTPVPGIQNLIFRIGIDGLRRLIFKLLFYVHQIIKKFVIITKNRLSPTGGLPYFKL